MADFFSNISVTMLRQILGFVVELDTQGALAIILLWRKLSHANRNLANLVAKLVVVDNVVLSFQQPERAHEKLAFIINHLKVQVKPSQSQTGGA